MEYTYPSTFPFDSLSQSAADLAMARIIIGDKEPLTLNLLQKALPNGRAHLSPASRHPRILRLG